MNFSQYILNTILRDNHRIEALKAVKTLNLPDWLLAAGFVRNAIWDRLYEKNTPLNDLDVIYFCDSDLSKQKDKYLEEQLFSIAPQFPWSVKNQARMHHKNQDKAYLSTLDAMSYWPEKQTSIGVQLNNQGKLQFKHCFDLSLWFDGTIQHNPTRSRGLFLKRVNDKGWLKTWPELTIKS